MKHWLALAALICFGSTATYAETDIRDVISSSETVITVLISSSVPTALFVGVLSGTTTQYLNIMGNRKTLDIQNIDPSTFTWTSCLIDVSSSLPAGYLAANQVQYGPAPTNGIGRAIWPQGQVWPTKLTASNGNGRYFIPWCKNNGGVASSSVTVTQGY